MLTRRHVQPEEHWSQGLDLPFRQGLRCGDMMFASGQVDLDWQRRVRNPRDPAAQVRGAMRYLRRVLEELGADTADLVRLTVFHAGGASLAEDDLLAELAACLDTRCFFASDNAVVAARRRAQRVGEVLRAPGQSEAAQQVPHRR